MQVRPVVVELIAFTAGAAVAAMCWPRRRAVLTIAALFVSLLFAILGVQALTGWHWHRSETLGVSATVHHTIGHHSIPFAAFVLPMLVAAALLHRSHWRRISHVAAILLLGTAWLFASISGYLRPDAAAATAPTLLRFVLIHMLCVPLLLGGVLLLLLWRHPRLAKRMESR